MTTVRRVVSLGKWRHFAKRIAWRGPKAASYQSAGLKLPGTRGRDFPRRLQDNRQRRCNHTPPCFLNSRRANRLGLVRPIFNRRRIRPGMIIGSEAVPRSR